MQPFMVIVQMMRLIVESEFQIFACRSQVMRIKLCTFCRAVVRELIETEEEFGRDLALVVEFYIKAVESAKCPKTVSDNKDIIFGNFKQIAEFHNT